VLRPGVRALIAILLVVACDAGERPARVVPPPAKLLAEPALASIDLTYLPANSDIVFRLDVAAMRTATLWTKHTASIWKLMLGWLATCDEPALRDVSSVTVGVPLESGPAVFVIRGIERATATRCMQAAKTVTFDGDVIATQSNGVTMLMMFVDATTLVIAGSQQPTTKQQLAQVVQSGAPLAKDAALVATHERIGRAPVTMVTRPSGKLSRQWAMLGVRPTDLYATMHVGDRLDLRVGMVLAAPEDASRLASSVKDQLAIAKRFFDRVEVSAHGNALTIDLGVTDVQLDALMSWWVEFLGRDWNSL
jgi:hypothetical protein